MSTPDEIAAELRQKIDDLKTRREYSPLIEANREREKNYKKYHRMKIAFLAVFCVLLALTVLFAALCIVFIVPHMQEQSDLLS